MIELTNFWLDNLMEKHGVTEKEHLTNYHIIEEIREVESAIKNENIWALGTPENSDHEANIEVLNEYLIILNDLYGNNITFTSEQEERIDEVENAVFELCKVMLDDDELEWDENMVGEVADAVVDILVDKGHKIYYPAIVTLGLEGEEYEELFEYVEPNDICDNN